MPPVEDVTARARQARDRGDVDALETLLRGAHEEAARSGNLDSYTRIAIFADWLVEAAQDHQNDKLVKQAAEEGVAAAERAVKLSPDSSEAHRLLGDSLGELIPHVFAGGIRYGDRARKKSKKRSNSIPTTRTLMLPGAPRIFLRQRNLGAAKRRRSIC